jgi:hypothetical protein
LATNLPISSFGESQLIIIINNYLNAVFLAKVSFPKSLTKLKKFLFLFYALKNMQIYIL